jgi:uncharacterized protein (TIGR03000 family)
MKKVVMLSAVAALALLVNAQTASARGRGGCGGYGGCGYSGCSSGGYSCGYGGCYSGGYGGYSSCGYSSGYGCATCGYGGGTYCAGGVCAVTGTSGTAMAAAPSMAATLVVSLPADAKLTIDGEATTSTSASRTFSTPDLPDAREHHYTLKAEVVRDGKVQTTTQQVTVRAGQTTQVELTLPAPTVAAQ